VETEYGRWVHTQREKTQIATRTFALNCRGIKFEKFLLSKKTAQSTIVWSFLGGSLIQLDGQPGVNVEWFVANRKRPRARTRASTSCSYGLLYTALYRGYQLSNGYQYIFISIFYEIAILQKKKLSRVSRKLDKDR